MIVSIWNRRLQANSLLRLLAGEFKDSLEMIIRTPFRLNSIRELMHVMQCPYENGRFVKMRQWFE